MEVLSTHWNSRYNGTVSFQELPRSDWSEDLDLSRVTAQQLCRWVPPYQISCRLPSDFDLSFRCTVDGQNNRHFSPNSGSPKLVPWAVLGGRLILEDRGEIHEDLPLDPGDLWFVFQYSLHRTEHLGPTRKLANELQVCAGGRCSSDERDILPLSLGVNAGINSEPWNMSRLRSEGLSAANAAGRPSSQDNLIYGLRAAAQCAAGFPEQNPKKINGLMRTALFSLGPSRKSLPENAFEYVAAQVKSSLDDHRQDSNQDFDRWIEDPKSNLVRRIVKRKDCHLSRQQVRQAILELAWIAFCQICDCIDAQMRAFRDALADPLIGYEKDRFDVEYLKQPQFGNVPILMLRDRFEFCRPGIIDILNDPNDQHTVAEFQLVLAYLAEMVEKRRKGNRLYKQHRNEKGRPVYCSPIGDGRELNCRDASPQALKYFVQPIAEARFDCDLESLEWDPHVVEQTEQIATLAIVCPALGLDNELDITLDQLMEAAAAE
jgi:hypothetical protein